MGYTNYLAKYLRKAKENNKKDPLATKESMTVLHNVEARRQEHDALKREQGFPEEQDPNAMRYQRFAEMETDEQGKIMHNKPPWVVNEASEMIAEINDEDAPTYKKSDKARNRAGKDTASVTKALFNSEGQNYGGVIAPQRYEIVEKGLGDIAGKIKDKITGGGKSDSAKIYDHPLMQVIDKYNMHQYADPTEHVKMFFTDPEKYHQAYTQHQEQLKQSQSPPPVQDMEKGLGDIARKVGGKIKDTFSPSASAPQDRDTYVNPNTGSKATPLAGTQERITRSPEFAARRAAQHGGLESDWEQGTEQKQGTEQRLASLPADQLQNDPDWKAMQLSPEQQAAMGARKQALHQKRQEEGQARKQRQQEKGKAYQRDQAALSPEEKEAISQRKKATIERAKRAARPDLSSKESIEAHNEATRAKLRGGKQSKLVKGFIKLYKAHDGDDDDPGRVTRTVKADMEKGTPGAGDFEAKITNPEARARAKDPTYGIRREEPEYDPTGEGTSEVMSGYKRSGEGKKQAPVDKKEEMIANYIASLNKAVGKRGATGQQLSGASIYEPKREEREDWEGRGIREQTPAELPPEDLSDIKLPDRKIENFLPALAGLAGRAALGAGKKLLTGGDDDKGGDDDMQMTEKAGFGSGGHARDQQRQFNRMASGQKKRYGNMGTMGFPRINSESKSKKRGKNKS